MKIVHIAPNSPYNDNWGYQENLLPKFQYKLGHEVTLIITNTMHKDGTIVETDCGEYILDDGVRVIRMKKKKYVSRALTVLNSRLCVYEHLQRLEPDFIFFHGLVSSTIFDAIKYKKNDNKRCVIVQDNHLDYNIGFNPKTLKGKFFQVWYSTINKLSIKEVEKVYGVTPWRKTYAEEFFGISESKTDVLIMGADDEKINFAQREYIRKNIRKMFNVLDEDFLIVTGGKIDKRKKIDKLMKAVEQIEGVKLLIFGNVLDDIKDEFEKILANNTNIIYVGWLNADVVYDYFFSADLVFFPGQHSVLWEQACASKVPCVFEKWEGMEHVNNGGNSLFITPVTVDLIEKVIDELNFTPKYYEMKTVAESDATDIYLYSSIAKKSIECLER